LNIKQNLLDFLMCHPQSFTLVTFEHRAIYQLKMQNHLLITRLYIRTRVRKVEESESRKKKTRTPEKAESTLTDNLPDVFTIVENVGLIYLK
jgi:hypothetical protein